MTRVSSSGFGDVDNSVCHAILGRNPRATCCLPWPDMAFKIHVTPGLIHHRLPDHGIIQLNKDGSLNARFKQDSD